MNRFSNRSWIPFVLVVLAALAFFYVYREKPTLLTQWLQPAGNAPGPQPETTTPFAWENALIHIEVTSKAYNYIQPWQPSERTVYKSGVLVEGHQILTTADGLSDQTLIRIKKQGSGLFSLGRVAWIDYQANLAALTTDDADFWTGLQPAQLADPVPITGPVRILRWNDDELENRQGEIEQMTVDNSALSFVSVPVLKIDSTIPNAGNGEAITADNKLIGLASAQGGDAVTAIPTSFIVPILKAEDSKAYTGLGYFDFTWDPAENPLCLEYLKLSGPTRGVIVKDTGLKPGVVSLVHPRDVILQIDGFDIDAEGNYPDPQYKKLSLENLSSRGKWAGMDCQMKIWRDGKELNIDYKLPKAEYSDELVPSQSFDKLPEYVMAGGFVFVPLTEAYLRSWGPTWRQRAPFRLSYYEDGKVTPERPQRVVLSQVLPSEGNIGYENVRNVVVDEVNGTKIKQISDVVTALKSPVNGFDVFTFAAGEPVRQAVLDASDMDRENEQIMARYHIRDDHVLNAVASRSDSDNPTALAPVVQK
jgi:hypothetical protein